MNTAPAQASGALGAVDQPLYDFSNMPVTLEQQIADTLVRIEVLLTALQKPVAYTGTPKPSRDDQIAALAARTIMGKKK
jgi:hypothetical protein